MISNTRLPVSCPARFGARLGFTIVELLVVVGMIGVLIALLMPALGRARESANSLKCEAQEWQIVQAMILHANEHKGYMPLVGWPHVGFDPVSLEDPRAERYDYFGTSLDNYHLMSILGALAPQLGQKINAASKSELEAELRDGIVRRIFVCPSDRDGDRIGGTVVGGGVAYNSYAFNEAALGWGTSVVPDGGVPDESGMMSNPYPHTRVRGKTARFPHPAQLFLFTDGAPRADGGWQVYCDSDADLSLRDFFVTTNGPPGNPHASMSPPPGNCSNWDLIDTTRHRGRINVAFADGHVENVPLDEGTLAKISMNKDFPAD